MPLSKRRFIIQMAGAPGTGKTTTAGSIAGRIDAVVINHDLIKSYSLESGMSFAEAGRLAYGLDKKLAEDFIITQGRSVVIDSPCFFQEILDTGRDLVGKAGQGWEWWYVETRVDDNEVLGRRLDERTRNGVMSCQVRGIEEGPLGDVNGEDGEKRVERWLKEPCRPDVAEKWVEGVVLLDMKEKRPGEALVEVLNRMRWNSA